MNTMMQDLGDKITNQVILVGNLEKIFELVNSGKFYLTGSRFFGTNNFNSDFDFFVDEVEFLKFEEQFRNLGFRQIRVSYNNDLSTLEVYRYSCFSIQIDIQVTHHDFVSAKISARNKIVKLLEISPNMIKQIFASKIRSSELWTELINISYDIEHGKLGE